MTDRNVVKNLLQSLTNKLLISSPEFAAALAHFDIITTYEDVKGNPDLARISGTKGWFYVVVFSAAHPRGQRYEFDCPEESAAFAAGARDGEVVL